MFDSASSFYPTTACRNRSNNYQFAVLGHAIWRSCSRCRVRWQKVGLCSVLEAVAGSGAFGRMGEERGLVFTSIVVVLLGSGGHFRHREMFSVCREPSAHADRTLWEGVGADPGRTTRVPTEESLFEFAPEFHWESESERTEGEIRNSKQKNKGRRKANTQWILMFSLLEDFFMIRHFN